MAARARGPHAAGRLVSWAALGASVQCGQPGTSGAHLATVLVILRTSAPLANLQGLEVI